MSPLVRETEPTQIAGPRTSPVATAPVNLLQITKPVVEIKAPAPELTEETGPSLLDKRRRRHARMSNRR